MNKLNCYAVPGERRCVALTPSCAFGLQGVIYVLRLPAFADAEVIQVTLTGV